MDFNDKDRTWSSPVDGRPELVPPLLTLTKQTLHRLIANKEAGLHSPKALTIIREVFAADPKLNVPDPKKPADPAKAAEFYQENLGKTEIIRIRLMEEGFDLS